MSIIEVVIASALAMVLALAFTTLITDMNNHRKIAEDKSDMFGAVQQLSYDLRFKQP